MKVVCFGAGYFGRNYIKELSHNLVAVVEPDKTKADFVSTKYNVEVYPELPSHIKFDGAIIVTPPDSHINLAKPLLEKGHYVLIEKPFSLSVEEAYKLNKYKNRVMAGMIYLYHPAVEALKKQVATTPIHHAYSRRTNNGPIRPWQDCVWDLATHDISIFNYIFGQSPVSAVSIGQRDYATVYLNYIAVNTMTYVSWVGNPKTRLVELVPADSSERIIFDDMKVTLEVSPLRLMLDDFLTGCWDDRCSFDAGVEVVNVLEKL